MVVAVAVAVAVGLLERVWRLGLLVIEGRLLVGGVLGYPNCQNWCQLKRYIHEIFNGSVWVVKGCSHRSFNIGSVETHGHQLLNCTVSGGTHAECTRITECRWSEG